MKIEISKKKKFDEAFFKEVQDAAIKKYGLNLEIVKVMLDDDGDAIMIWSFKMLGVYFSGQSSVTQQDYTLGKATDIYAVSICNENALASNKANLRRFFRLCRLFYVITPAATAYKG